MNMCIVGISELCVTCVQLRESREEVAPEVILSGDRIATFMIYVSTPHLLSASHQPPIQCISLDWSVWRVF